MSMKEHAFCRTAGQVQKRILKQDIQRGVKFITETSYCKSWGATGATALFFMELRKHINLDSTYRVDMTHNNDKWYTIRIFTKEGYIVQFKGFSFGYYGQGSRATKAMLQELGFNARQIKKMFETKEQCRLYRRVTV